MCALVTLPSFLKKSQLFPLLFPHKLFPMVFECISVMQCLHVYMNYTKKNLLSKSKAF